MESVDPKKMQVLLLVDTKKVKSGWITLRRSYQRSRMATVSISCFLAVTNVHSVMREHDFTTR